MDIHLIGKRAIICGSTQGIGKAAAEEFSTLGATVILIARNEEKLQQVRDSLSTPNQQKHEYITADFSNPEYLQEKIQAYMSTNPPVHILVNNTGGPPGGNIIDASPEEFLKAYNMHLMCNQILVQACVKGMKTENYGRIINIISTSVRQPIPGLGVSNTTRGAVASWSKTLAGELGTFGITVNNVLPGSTDTQRLRSIFQKRAERNNTSAEEEAEKNKLSIPLRRFADPKETAYAIAFLASPSASYISGTNLPVDGGRIACL
ncbi:MAG: SDR family oxidoreductase [Candidatus Kariarchaeaceae archaeon]